jgi:hypothetical protein
MYNLNKELKDREANDIIDLLEDTVDDLSRFSVDNDDKFNSECYEMYELIKRARRNI